MAVAVKDLDAAIAVCRQALPVAFANQAMKQLEVAAEAKHARRPAAENQIFQRYLLQAEMTRDQRLPLFEIGKHRRGEARPGKRTHECPKRATIVVVENVELVQVEQ